MSVTRPVAWAKSWVHAGLVIGQTRIVPGFISSKCSADNTSDASPTIKAVSARSLLDMRSKMSE